MFAPKNLFTYRPYADISGLTVNQVNFVRWEDIISAERTSFLWLPYLRIILKKQNPPFFMLKWLVPLYLGDLADFLKQIDEFCPKDHPVRKVLLEV